ncbi:MAG: VF530 family DNA-binding protein [Aeromonas sp.]
MSEQQPSEQSASQKKNPLHGLTLEAIVTALVAHYGWAELGQQINIHCFTDDPSIKSSLKFLRKTPWAREKVESLYLYVQRKQAKLNKEGPDGI